MTDLQLVKFACPTGASFVVGKDGKQYFPDGEGNITMSVRYVPQQLLNQALAPAS